MSLEFSLDLWWVGFCMVILALSPFILMLGVWFCSNFKENMLTTIVAVGAWLLMFAWLALFIGGIHLMGKYKTTNTEEVIHE